MNLAALPADFRSYAAEQWRQVALLEHASVASFARFTLQLMAVGAPPELLEASQQAGIDEIRHARIAFELAALYSGEVMGPGPLAIDGALLEGQDLPGIARATVAEGCIGETLGSLEAAAALEMAEEPEVEKVLRTIAEDEAAHAELAWAFVRWALTAGGDETRRAVEEAFAAGLEPMGSPPPARADEPLLRRHGLLSPRTRFEIHRRGRRDVIGPAAHALLGTPLAR